ncbi:UDP-glycosyltransferase 1 [Linum grandiflorum]
MVDIARLFAVNGVNVTILTTTTNARLISSAIDHDARSGLRISLITLTFPCQEAGLPEGCENLLSAPTPEINFKLFHGIKLLQPELGIPRLAFSGSGFFNLCIADSIESNNPHGGIESETEEFVVPGIPHLLGPVSLFINRINLDVENINRSGKATDNLSNWLNSKKSNSVLYVCLGSLTRFSKNQISEIATALEELNYPFIWEVEWWLPQGFEEKMVKESGKGVIIKGWAPQTVILKHASIGGFVTHCGWNSIMEGVCGGVPMVTWPIFAEQFYNEKLVTQVLKFGVSVGNEVWSVWATEESPLIKAEKMKSAIDVVMGQGAEATKMREKVKILADMAKKAVEIGGSSDCDLKSLLNDLREYKRTRDNGLLNR